MPVIGLTGGVASGKSTVAARLRDKVAVILDADQAAREVVEPGSPALAEIGRRFGEAVMAPSGSLDRTALARLVFSDPQALNDLNSIMHPRIFALLGERSTEHPPEQVVVVEAALLAETYNQAQEWLGFTALITVEADPEQQMARLGSQRGLGAAEARRRLEAQAGPAERKRLATHVIDNSGSLEDLAHEVDRVWADLTG